MLQKGRVRLRKDCRSMAEEQDREGGGRREMRTDYERSYLERYWTVGGRRICDIFSYAR